MTYDTTFNIGDLYSSPLILKNLMFTAEPAVPLGFLYHEKRISVPINIFSSTSKNKFQISKHFVSWRLMAIDGEEAINNAVKIELPKIPILRCWRHFSG